MAKVPNGVETVPKISIAWVWRTNVTDDRQTDGRAIAYSEREPNFGLFHPVKLWEGGLSQYFKFTLESKLWWTFDGRPLSGQGEVRQKSIAALLFIYYYKKLSYRRETALHPV